MPRSNKPVVPGDLRKPTVRMSYNPGYELCVIISSCETQDYGSQIPRLPAVILDPRRQLMLPYNVRASAISSPDNIVLRGEEP